MQAFDFVKRAKGQVNTGHYAQFKVLGIAGVVAYDAVSY